MTKEERINYITAVCDRLKLDSLQKVDEIPEQWEEKEMRWYVGDKATELLIDNIEYTHSQEKKRHNDYRNVLLIKNL